MLNKYLIKFKNMHIEYFTAEELFYNISHFSSSGIVSLETFRFYDGYICHL